MTFLEAAAAVDRFLLRVNRRVQYAVIAATVLHMIAVAIPNVPRPYLDYSRFPLLSGVHQIRQLRYGHDRQFVRRQGRVERSARHVHQGAPRADTAREGDVDQGGISSLPAGFPAHGGGAVCHRGGDGHRLLRHGRAARRAVRRALPLVFPEDAVVSLSSLVPELRVLRTPVRLRAGRHLSRHARGGHDCARRCSIGGPIGGPLEAPGQPHPDGARHHDEALAGGVRAGDRQHAAWHGDDLRRHPVRRVRAALFHLGQLPDHLHLPRPGQRQHLRLGRGGRAGRALHDRAVVRRDSTRVRHGGSDRVVAGAVRDVRRHQDARRPAPADRAPGAGQAWSAQHRGIHRPRAPRRRSGGIPARVGALHHDGSALRVSGVLSGQDRLGHGSRRRAASAAHRQAAAVGTPASPVAA